MKNAKHMLCCLALCTSAALCLLLAATPARATWPTTVRENLLIADTSYGPTALPYSDDRILIIFRDGMHTVYQILDRYGNIVYPISQPLTLTGNDSLGCDSPPKAIPDGCGGALIAWYITASFPDSGVYAQRLDSQGNRLWGDSAIRIFDRWPVPAQYDICSDGEGGLFLAATYLPAGFNYSDLFLQHVTAQGQLPWGIAGRLAFFEPHEQRYPEITSDGNGGIFAVWDDWRAGYPGALYRQHFGAEANPLWTPASGLYTCGHTMFRQVIPDEQGGFILHTDPGGGEVNWVYRFAPTGELLWSRDHVSWWNEAKMVPGEPGFFYLGFRYEYGVWAQRMDMNGTLYWPTWGSGRPGALMKYWPNLMHHGADDFAYLSPYFYGLLAYERLISPYLPRTQWVQALDMDGNRVWGDSAVLVARYNTQLYQSFLNRNIVPQADGGVVAVWERWDGYLHEVYAKRVTGDGSLGGPFPLEMSLTPYDPPIQIPPAGGNFIYDLSIADTDSVGGTMDVWIEVTLPNGSPLGILARNDLTIQPNGTLIRNNLQQVVPVRAPAGTYIYTVYAGNYAYQSPWGQDSFTFEKLGTRGWGQVAGNSEWTLEGWDEPSTEPAALGTYNLDLRISPNPFNPTTALSYQLSADSYVSLKIYDTAGRLVMELVNGWREAGNHRVTFDGSQLPSGIYLARLEAGEFTKTQKLVLLK